MRAASCWDLLTSTGHRWRSLVGRARSWVRAVADRRHRRTVGVLRERLETCVSELRYWGTTAFMENDDDFLNARIRERRDREPSRDPLPSDGSQGTNATGNAPTEGDEGGAGTQDRPHAEPEDD